jgi:hypothetical protein
MGNSRENHHPVTIQSAPIDLKLFGEVRWRGRRMMAWRMMAWREGKK